MIFLNEDNIKSGDYFRLPFKPDKARRMLASKYGRNPDDFEYDQANNYYVYKPKRNYGDNKSSIKISAKSTVEPTNITQTPPETSQQNDGFMKVNVEWMREKYDKFNQELFDGRLPQCNFIANGSGGKKFGWFCLKGRNLQINPYNRRMYQVSGWDKIPIDRSNFYQLCQPTIGMNTNYSGKEIALENTLIHEMCHYYTYMNGYAPKQGHGPEFRDIANYVSNKGNLKYRIARFGDGDRNTSCYKLDDKLQQQKERRVKNAFSNAKIMLVGMKNGETRLIKTTSQSVIDDVIQVHTERNDYTKMYIYHDENVTSYFGRTKNFRTYRYWPLSRSIDDIISDLGSAKPIKVITNHDMNNENEQTNKKLVETITEMVIDEIKNNIGVNDAIPISPDMDLSEMSPLEIV